MAKIGLIVGNKFSDKPAFIYDELRKGGYEPDFTIFCFPSRKRIQASQMASPLIRFFASLSVIFFPISVLKIVFNNFTPPKILHPYFVKDINSRSTYRIIEKECPDFIIVHSCGILSKKTCNKFQGKFVLSHAGKLPEYRGVNNVEWAYLLGDEVFGTIQQPVEKMDRGDIVYQEKLKKLSPPISIDEIRDKAFRDTFKLFPKALKNVDSSSPKIIKQPATKSNRYVMHNYIRNLLKKKLSNN